MPEPKPFLESGAPVKVDLGIYNCPRGQYQVQLVIRRPLLGYLIRKALDSKAGRAVMAMGGIAVLVKRAPSTPAAREERAA